MELLTEKEKQEFLNSVAQKFCPNCGAAVIQPPMGRTKKFCSDRCRFHWKNTHPRPENWKMTRTAVCQFCGKEFLAFKEYEKKRRYCSRACANRGRAAGKKNKTNEEQESP